MKTPPIIVNRQAGRLVGGSGPLDRATDWLGELDRDAGVRFVDPGDLERVVEDQIESGARRLVVGGGDGTLCSVAGIIDRLRSDVALVCLPLGTHNHFTKDLGIPQEVDGWAPLLHSERLRRVDLGAVNGRLFLNNLSIGLYPALLRLRRNIPRERLLGSKRLASLYASYRLWGSIPKPFELRWGDEHAEDGPAQVLRTRLLVVSNNRYADEPLAPLSRRSLDEGMLSLIAPEEVNLTKTVRMAWYAINGNLASCPDLSVHHGRAFDIELPPHVFTIAVDGELRRTEPTLRVRVHPEKLTVVLPPSDG